MRNRMILAALVATLGVAATGCGDTGDAHDSKPSPAGETRTAEAEPAGPTYDTPSADDFALKVKTLQKECFGSAGCNVTFRVELSTTSFLELDPAATYELTYAVRGGEDPYINTLEVTGDEYSQTSEEFISTATSGANLRAVITDVTEY